MPVSFWIFLVLSVIAFLALIDDHGETLEEFKESIGAKKRRKSLKLFAMWFGCIGGLIGTLVLGWESRSDAKKIPNGKTNTWR